PHMVQFLLCISPLNNHVFSLHVPKLAQTLPECFDAGQVSGWGGSTYVPYPRDFLRLLRLGGQGKRKEHGARVRTMIFFFISFSLSRSHLLLDTCPPLT